MSTIVNVKEVDFLLNNIRNACELGEVEQVLIMAKNLKIITEAESFSLERLENGSIEKSFIDKNGISYCYKNVLDILSPFVKKAPNHPIGVIEELAIISDDSTDEYIFSLEDGEPHEPSFDYEKYSKDHFDIDLKRKSL
jgi:hypothetical protein